MSLACVQVRGTVVSPAPHEVKGGLRVATTVATVAGAPAPTRVADTPPSWPGHDPWPLDHVQAGLRAGPHPPGVPLFHVWRRIVGVSVE